MSENPTPAERGAVTAEIQCCLARLSRRFSGPYGGGVAPRSHETARQDIAEIKRYIAAQADLLGQALGLLREVRDDYLKGGVDEIVPRIDAFLSRTAKGEGESTNATT